MARTLLAYGCIAAVVALAACHLLLPYEATSKSSEHTGDLSTIDGLHDLGAIRDLPVTDRLDALTRDNALPDTTTAKDLLHEEAGLCSAVQLWCGDRCVDPMNDDEHCGQCDNPCSQGTSCESGSCACLPGRLCAGCCENDVCYPGDTVEFCGTGGESCATCVAQDPCTDEICQGGACAYLPRSEGNVCFSGGAMGSCYNGECCTGCWDNGCLSIGEQNDMHCGSGGVTCYPCPGSMRCIGGDCMS